jgi:LytTr DNA-binding domain
MRWIWSFFFLLMSPSALAQDFHWVETASVRICPADAGQEIPDFSSDACVEQHVFDLDPQGRMLWARFNLSLPASFVSRSQPTGLYLSAAAASRAYLNSVPLGENGRPGINRDEEIPGQMDAVLFVPPAAMRAGENELVLLMSAHHGAIEFRNPIHTISLARYGRAQDRILWAYAPSLAPLGLFVLGVLVFGFRSIRSEDREAAFILLLASVSISIQLIAEVSRGLFTYEYPVHSIRILLILTGAGAFSLFLLAHALKRFLDLSAGWRWFISVALLVLALSLTTFLQGFDPKTALLLFAAYTGVFGLAAWGVWKRKQNALVYFALSGAFMILMVWRPDLSLDVGGFYIGAALFTFLLIEQASALIRARRTILDERGKSARLELALEQSRQRAEPGELQLTSAGRIRRLPVGQIINIRAAGDYSEIMMNDGRSELFTVSLSELESRLPETFLRVHRSHIVNTAFVANLNREASGVGELVLSNTTRIPVSRRIMPSVRSALAD